MPLGQTHYMAILCSPKNFVFGSVAFMMDFMKCWEYFLKSLFLFFTSELHLFSLCSYPRRLIILLKKFFSPQNQSQKSICVQSFIDHSEKSQRQFNSERQKQSNTWGEVLPGGFASTTVQKVVIRKLRLWNCVGVLFIHCFKPRTAWTSAEQL